MKKVLSFYKYFKFYGYSDGKISALVRSYCKGRIGIEKTFMKVKKLNMLSNESSTYEYRTDLEDIIKQVVEILERKNDKNVEEYFYHFF